MGVSRQDALNSLDLIRDAATRTRRAVAADYAGNLLILWGLIWIAGFTAVHFAPHRGGRAFAVLDGLGIVATILLCRRWPAWSDVTGPSASGAARRMLIFWLALLVYGGLWILLLRPANGMLLGTFLATVAMLGYVVIGLWSGSSFLVALGLTVTALTLLGYYLIPGYFYLGMAVAGGGALLSTGLYIRARWR